MGKSTINGVFLIALLIYQSVYYASSFSGYSCHPCPFWGERGRFGILFILIHLLVGVHRGNPLLTNQPVGDLNPSPKKYSSSEPIIPYV